MSGFREVDPVQRSLQLKRQREQRERAKTTGVRRRFFKKAVKEAEQQEQQQLRGRRFAGAEDDDDAAAGRSPQAPAEGAEPAAPSSSRKCSAPAAAAATQDAGIAGPTRLPHPAPAGRAHVKHKPVPKMLATQNRFSTALRQQEANRLAAQSAQQASDARAVVVASKRKERKALSRRYQQRTMKGQPVMRHRAQDLLARVERLVGVGK